MTFTPAQKTFLLTTAQAAAKAIAMFFAAHGFIAGTSVEAWAGIIVFAMSYAYSIYNDQGRVVLAAAFDVMRWRILNEDAKIKAGTTTPAAAMSKLADHAGQVAPLASAPVPPVASAIALAIGLALVLASHPAAAQTRLPSAAPRANAIGQPCDPLNLIPGCKEQATSKGIDDLVSKLDTLSLPDFEFALAQAKAANNEVTQPCWSAWVDLIKARQAAAIGPDGQPLPLPDPHIITAIERISELLALLRPDSKISLACVQIANVAGKDAATVLTGILSGGALGLFKLPIVPIP